MRGRIRSIKPELFTDEKLWDLGQETGLPVLQAFAGMWCYADREGRFEWRPRALKVAILPYWEGDFSRVLDALTTRGFLHKYEVEGRQYGVVVNFSRHQTPNNREKPSEIPEPPEDSWTSTREARVDDASGTGEPRDSIQKESSGNRILGTELGASRDTRALQSSAKSKERKPRRRTDRDDCFDLVRDAFEAAHQKAHGVPQGIAPSLLTVAATWLLSVPAERRQEVCLSAVDGFFADPYWAKQGCHPFKQFSDAPGTYVGKKPANDTQADDGFFRPELRVGGNR